MPPPDPPPAGSPSFSARVVYQSVHPVPAEVKKRISVPAGVEVRQPFYASLAGIVLVRQARQRRFNYQDEGGLGGIAAGFTDTDLSVAFADFARSWQRDGEVWKFLGGGLVLTLSVGVHIDERTRQPARRRCMEMILEHELLHVRDEIDIVTKWLPQQALADALVRANLSANARVPAAHFDEWIRGDGDGRNSDLERRLQRELYIAESGARAAALHRSRPKDTQRISACLA
ncbi:MAG: hypothetical protein ACREE7_16515 [Dongiaceae bacterium]